MDDTSVGGVDVQTEPERAPTSELDAIRSANERIGVGSADENVARIQLAARWAETYGQDGEDSLEAALHRFRRAYTYIDSVTHGLEPEES